MPVKIENREYNYTGMICNSTNKPQGFGRAFSHKYKQVYDGQFKDGYFHGFVRFLNEKGNIIEVVY